MRTSSWTVAALIARTAVIALAETSAPPLPIPVARGADHITVEGPGRERAIRDQGIIEQFVAFLIVRNTGWRKPLDTFPAPRWTIHLIRPRGADLVLWLGPNWLAGGKDKRALKR